MALGILTKLQIIWNEIICTHPVMITNLMYKNIWNLRRICRENPTTFKKKLYYSYFEHYGGFIGLGAELEDIPIFPHGLLGIFISNSAKIGKNVVIFHQVTIGSNMIKGSKKQGAPTIEDSVYIGCGAKLIGNINVGKRARIGANCIVVNDVPENSLCILKGYENIIRETPLDNEWIINEY